MNFRKETCHFSIFLLFCKGHFVYILNCSRLLTIRNYVLEFTPHSIKVFSFFFLISLLLVIFYVFSVSPLHITFLPIVFLFFLCLVLSFVIFFLIFFCSLYLSLCLVFNFRSSIFLRLYFSFLLNIIIVLLYKYYIVLVPYINERYFQIGQ